jgi:predicted DNA-binding ribbon-helix-helix protein
MINHGNPALPVASGQRWWKLSAIARRNQVPAATFALEHDTPQVIAVDIFEHDPHSNLEKSFWMYLKQKKKRNGITGFITFRWTL